MAELAAKYLTLADTYRQRDPSGAITAKVIEMLAKSNPVIEQMPMMECNDGTRHLNTVRSGLPEPTWRKLYKGVQPTKSTTKQVHDVTGFAEDWVEIDAKLLEITKNANQLRLNEAKAHIEGMAQDLATNIFYGNTDVDPEKFMGLAPRFNSLSAENGGQIVDAGGTGSDNTSVWFVTLDESTCHGLFPQGTQAGVKRKDLGIQVKENSDGTLYEVAREKFEVNMGLTVPDWRYISCIRNIDVSDLLDGTVDIYKFMRQALYKNRYRLMPKGRLVIFCNGDVKEALDAKATSGHSGTATVQLKPMEIDGKEVDSYRGKYPIYECEAITSQEGQVS